MGLSTKQVSSDGHGWNQALMQGGNNLELPKPSNSMKKQASSQQQQQQQQADPLKCPRCDSTNTKFCYYNNYNKSQPRHFCKTCKRHWTKGGTLRNVPVGGGRKNKRKASSNNKAASKTTTSTTTTATTTTTTTTPFNGLSNKDMTIQPQQPRLSLPLTALGTVGVDEKNFCEAFYQTLGRQRPESSITFNGKSSNDGNNNGIFLGSLPQNDHHQELQFPYSNLSSFESNPCSISSTISSIQSPNLYNYNTGDQASALEETVMNSLNTTMSSSSMSDHHQTWGMPTSTSSVMDMSSNWGWDDFDKFVSVDADLTIPWDDSEIKP